jgi:hypothetical protein
VAVVCSKLCFEELKQLWRSDYVRMLEEEVSLLRAENRALMNSLLGTTENATDPMSPVVRANPLPAQQGRAGPRRNGREVASLPTYQNSNLSMDYTKRGKSITRKTWNSWLIAK